MNRLLFMMGFMLIVPVAVHAQSERSVYPVDYKYQLKVNNQRDQVVIEKMNGLLEADHPENGGNARGVLGTAIMSSFSNILLQKTMRTSSNIVDLGIDIITESVQKSTTKYRFNEWERMASQRNKYSTSITMENQMEDFYYTPSFSGPFDASNLKFDGFTCVNYLETSSGEEEDGYGVSSSMGHEVFYIRCSLRADSLGIAEMANHSKFLLQLDTLAFYPDWCNVPTDLEIREKGSFDYSKRTGLCLKVNVKVYSSWINPAVQIQDEVQLGQFDITALIRENALIERDGERVFIYNGTGKAGDNIISTASLVSLSGDSFIVPRSYVSGIGGESWGTGQYRLEINITEECRINNSYYLVRNGSRTKPQYDKDKWMLEWRSMKTQEHENLFKEAWVKIKDACIKGDRVKEVVTPFKTSIRSEDSRALKNVLSF